MDLTVELHRTFLRDGGKPRQGLSERETQQAIARSWVATASALPSQLDSAAALRHVAGSN